MKFKYRSLLTPIFTLASLLILSACGSTGNSSDTQLVAGSVQGQAPYTIDAYTGTTAVVHAQGDHTGTTHSWTQTSGPAVTLTTPNAPTTTFTTPGATTTPVTLTHTTTHPTTGITVATPHTINAIPPLPTGPLMAIVGKPSVSYSGQIASLHASATGGTAPYTYDWIAPSKITLDTTHSTSPTFTVPQVATTEVLTFGLQVMDANGDTVTSNEVITITQRRLILDPQTKTKTINDNQSKSVNGPHPASSGFYKITNPISSESYTWTVKEQSTNPKPSLINLNVTAPYNTTADITFLSPDVTTSSTYVVILKAQNSQGTRIGEAVVTVIINP